MTTPTRRLELVAIDDLVDDPSNPKGHAEAEIDASIDTPALAHTRPGGAWFVCAPPGPTTIELDPLYADVICRRWQETTGDLPVRVAGASHGPHDFARPGA